MPASPASTNGDLAAGQTSMQLLSPHDQMMVGELRPGDFFAFHIRGETYFGVALGMGQDRPHPALVALHPGRPDLMEIPGFLFSNLIRGPVLRYPCARIRLPVAREHTHIGFNGAEPDPGALFLVEGRLCVAARFDVSAVIYDLTTGIALQHEPADAIWFSEWQIVEGTAPDARVICTIRTQSRGLRRN